MAIKQIVLQTEWSTNQRIYQMSASMEIGYPLRDGKQYTQADIEQAREDLKESESKLNAALAEGYTLFASIPLKDSIGVNLILYKPDINTGFKRKVDVPDLPIPNNPLDINDRNDSIDNQQLTVTS